MREDFRRLFELLRSNVTALNNRLSAAIAVSTDERCGPIQRGSKIDKSLHRELGFFGMICSFTL
jgi:hypothetical protein